MIRFPEATTKGINISTLLFVILLIAGMIIMPYFADDLWYFADIHSARKNGGQEIEAAFNTIAFHYRIDNARLANIVFTMFLLLPKWIGNLLCMGAFTFALFLSYRLVAQATARKIPFVAGAVMLFLWCFALPWNDYMYLECYQFNYLISTALTVSAIYLALMPQRHTSVWMLVGMFIFGLITGAWHEGFSAPLAAGLFALCLFFPAARTPRNYTLLAGVILGLIWLIAAPVALSRLSLGHTKESSILLQILKVSALHPAFFIAVVWCMVTFLRHSTRSILTAPLPVILGVSALASFDVHILSIAAPRAGWWGEFASTMLIGYFMVSYSVKGHRFITIGAMGLIFLVLARVGIAGFFALEYRKDYALLVHEYEKSADGEVHLDFIPEYSSPLLAWMMPSFYIYYDKYQTSMFTDCYGAGAPGKTLKVIPPAALSAATGAGERLGGNIEARKNGHFYMCRLADLLNITGEFPKDEPIIYADLKYGPFTLSSMRVFCFRYKNTSGDEMVLLMPWRVFPISKVFPLEEITVVVYQN